MPRSERVAPHSIAPRTRGGKGAQMKSRRIMIITDSISMPRHGIRYEDTWIHLLKKKFPGHDVIDRPARGSTSTRLVTEGGGGLDLLESYMPDTVILQQGMAECAPRLFDKKGWEFFIVSRVLPGGIRRRYIDRVKRTRVRNPAVTDVDPEQFRRNITSFFERAALAGARVIIVPIFPPTGEYIRKSPHIRRNVDLYNGIYRETASRFPHVMIVDPFPGRGTIDDIAIDEIHVNPEGHRMIFDSLEPHIARRGK